MQRVCGEYVSNEVLEYLNNLGVFPKHLSPPEITHFELSSIRGKSATARLDMGGFGISRFAFDHYLYEQARARGVSIELNKEVTSIAKDGDEFILATSDSNYRCDLVVGAFGKRSRLDVSFNREFLQQRSPYVGVKYHVIADHPRHLVSLHNFPGGYCGVAAIEHGKTNLCYLVNRERLKQFKDVQQLEEHVLTTNPILRKIFSSATFIDRKPMVINEISFQTKTAVEEHVLMAGDSAGMVAPVFGNGMAIAIRAGMVAGRLASEFCKGNISRKELEDRYTAEWNKLFSRRLIMGRAVQRLFGSHLTSSATVELMRHVPVFAKAIIRGSHGQTFS